jgi:long-chain acyl-CoA synthetase
MQEVKTVLDVFRGASSRGSRVAMKKQDGSGTWQPITSAQLYGLVRKLAESLSAWGVAAGDRVALISENRWEWQVTDFAILALGAADVPIYPTLTVEQFNYMLNDSGAKVAIVSSKVLYEKVIAAGDVPSLEHVVVMDEGVFPNAVSFASLVQGSEVFEQPDTDFDAKVKAVTPEQMATLIYTSGTTGEPKGVVLSHGNLASNLTYSTAPFHFSDKDSGVSYLPLSHVTARALDYALLIAGACVSYCPKFDKLTDALKALHPTVFVGVPRVYEKIRQAVEGKASKSKISSSVLKWAIGTGHAHRAETLSGKEPGGLGWTIANKLVFSKLREAFGGCVHTFIAGGAPLGEDTAGWFADAGIRVFEGYGLTETSPVIGLNNPEGHRMCTVGKPLSNLELRFASDGELEVRGPSVFKQYWGKEKETKEAYTEDGFFKTGDIGKLDQDGFLMITDRKKELLKTSGGKFIAPQPIENKLKANRMISNAALVGDKHKYVSVLLSPNLGALKEWAGQQGVSSGNNEEMVRDPKVVGMYQKIVDEVNGSLAHHESIKRIAVVAEEWSVEEGELTPSMKIKRRVLDEKYSKQIGEFYADEATSRGE